MRYILNSKTTRKQINGFTLVELLVVISIIAMLLAILMPSLSKARQQALKTVCQNNTHQWALGIQMYAADYNGYFPTYHYQGRMPSQIIVCNRYYAAPFNSSNMFPHDLISSFFKRYLPVYSVVWCPDTPGDFRSTGKLRKKDFDTMLKEANAGTDKQIIGDYVFFVGQDFQKFKSFLWTKNKRSGGEVYFVPPMKTSMARPEMAVMGDTIKGDLQTGLTEVHHPFARNDSGTRKPPNGMNAAFNDGSSKWVPWKGITHHTIYGWSNGYTFLWPDPKKSGIGNYWGF